VALRLRGEEIYFNAARLDRSMVLKMNDYVAVAKPRLERIAEELGEEQSYGSELFG